MSKEYEQTIKDRFPNLEYSEFRIVDNSRERLGIEDVSIAIPEKDEQVRESVESFIMACKGFIYFYSAQDLSARLNDKLDSLLGQLDPKKTLLVFPGNGAKTTKDLMRPEIFKFFGTLDLEVMRVLEDNMSVSRVNVLTGKNEIRKVLPKKIEACVLIDDVLLTGSTAQSSRQFLSPLVDEVQWYGSTWMALSPLQSKTRRDNDAYKSSLPGFSRVVTVVLYQGTNGVPANNSLSSFIESGERSKIITERYKEKYVEDLETFETALDSLRRLKNE